MHFICFFLDLKKSEICKFFFSKNQFTKIYGDGEGEARIGGLV